MVMWSLKKGSKGSETVDIFPCIQLVTTSYKLHCDRYARAAIRRGRREKFTFLGRKEQGSVHEISNLILELVKFNLQKMRKLSPSDKHPTVKIFCGLWYDTILDKGSAKMNYMQKNDLQDWWNNSDSLVATARKWKWINHNRGWEEKDRYTTTVVLEWFSCLNVSITCCLC